MRRTVWPLAPGGAVVCDAAVILNSLMNSSGKMVGQEAVGIAHIAMETGLSRQTIYRIKEAALAAWERR
jgi:hypothetical protein